MPPVHRHGDGRTCGATTVVSGQTTVKVNGKLWAVEGDGNSHGGGALSASGSTVKIGGIKVIVHTPDAGAADSLCPIDPDHCSTPTNGGSGNVNCY